MRAVLALAMVVAALTVIDAPRSAAAETITIDGQGSGRVFDGLGGVSAGASSRMLYDYPEPERGQILDYLFKPGYGAAMQSLKVEIGGDTNSTSGSEASHMQRRGEINCNRGYEWWLMKEAKQRNPDITLAGLEWGAPGWFDGGFWSQDNIDYLLAWLGCAESHGLTIDYVGGWNERGYNADWYVALDRALAERYPDVQIVGSDEINRWAIVDEMETNEALRKAVDVVGIHFICGNRDDREHCESPQNAKDIGKPLWMSEVSALSHDAGAAPAARSMNRMYIDAKATGYLTWSPVSAWDANLPLADTGTILAQWPWSGYYEVGSTVWSFAHTTQFSAPGWSYIDSASGYLASGASYVSRKSPDGKDFSTVVETMDATAPTTTSFRVTGGLSAEELQLWSTNVASSDPDDDFIHQATLQPNADGAVTVTLEPGHIYTLTNTTGQGKGDGAPAADVHERMQLPYAEDFESTDKTGLASYFSDVNGAFEAAPCAGGRTGSCYRQQTPTQPIQWNGAGAMDPTTLMGDPRWWGDYVVSTRFLLEEEGYVELLGRVAGHASGSSTSISGYHLRVSSNGDWRLYNADYHAGERKLASGSVDIGVGAWHRMSLRMQANHITVYVDGERLARVRHEGPRTGSVGLLAQGWKHVQFDDVTVEPIGQRPRFAPKGEMSATATSEMGFDGGYLRGADNVVDDRVETFWRSDPDQALPQSVTVDLGKQRSTHGVVVQPRRDSGTTGMVTDYNVSLSNDGEHFTKVASGTWAVNKATKVVTWARQSARYVRLEAIGEGCGAGSASIGELDVALTSVQPSGEAGDTGEPAYDFVPQSEVSATASDFQTGWEPELAVDDNCETFWHSQFDPRVPLPHSITLDLGTSYDVEALSYQSRQDGNSNGYITEYVIEVSADGQTFTEVASGAWALDPTTKIVDLAEPVSARYVRLTANNGGGGHAAAAEIRVVYVAP